MGIARFQKALEYFTRKIGKQKDANEKRKLEQLKKPTEVQLNKQIEDKVNAKIDSNVPNKV